MGGAGREVGVAVGVVEKEEGGAVGVVEKEEGGAEMRGGDSGVGVAVETTGEPLMLRILLISQLFLEPSLPLSNSSFSPIQERGNREWAEWLTSMNIDCWY